MSLRDRGRGEPARPAFYALAPGGWRDYWTLLHPPYTLWHLSYVVIGASLAPAVSGERLGATLLAFFLAVGLAAHALDELSGRPLRTRIPAAVLGGIGAGGLTGAVGLGVAGAARVSWWLLAFVAFGALADLAYNLELAGGRFHTDWWFALAWGGFPALTGYFAQGGAVRWPAAAAAAGCALLSLAQRRLSAEVRRLRRTVVAVEGRVVLRDGTEQELDERALLRAPEAALRILSVAMPLLATGLVAARLG